MRFVQTRLGKLPEDVFPVGVTVKYFFYIPHKGSLWKKIDMELNNSLHEFDAIFDTGAPKNL